MSATASHVFISHGSDDRDEAAALAAFIEARGIRTWIAPRDVRPGQDYSEQLQLAIENCAAFVVLVTDKANTSPYVRAETEMAFSTHKPIFPVRQSDVQPAAGLAFFLKIRHWTDAFGKHGDSAMERLGLELDALGGAVKAETGPVPAPAEAQPPVPPPPAPSPQPPTAAPPASPPVETRPPQPEPVIAPPPLSAAQEERLAAAIGPNAAWYIERWRRMEANRSWLSWNWPAFLANIFWFAYRKMWVPLAVGIALFLLTSFVTGRNPALIDLGWLFLLALAALSGVIGNALYRRQVARLVAKADGLDQPVALAQIRAQGGISVPGLATSLVVFVVLLIATAVQQINQPRMPVNPPVQPNGPVQPEQPTPVPAPAPAPAAPMLDSAYMVGRWTSDGNCGSIFSSDGTFQAYDGGTGQWSLAGDQLTLTANSTLTLRVVPIDMNTMTLINPDGSLIRANRC